MRATRRFFEIRACALALLVHGVVAPLAAHPAAEPGVAPTGASSVVAPPLVSQPPGSVPAVLTGVAGVPAGARTVALTFDDGPDPRWTPRVLELLAEHGAVATFCLVGEQAIRHPELVAAIVDAGMQLCDHTHAHVVDPATPGAALARDELADLARAEVPWFRAPGGLWSAAVQQAAGARGMLPLGWSVDSRDWTRPGSGAILARVQRRVHPGAVVLLHDGGGSREQTVAALEQLLPWLAEQCYVTTFPDGRR